MDEVGNFFFGKEKEFLAVIAVFLSMDRDRKDGVHFYKLINDGLVEYCI